MKIFSTYTYVLISAAIVMSNIRIGKCQLLKTDRHKLSITQVEIKDSELRDSICAYILNEASKDSVFSKLGYISLSFGRESYKGQKTLYSCTYNISYDPLLEDEDVLPLFYTYICNRIVVIKDDNTLANLSYRFDKRKAKLFRSKLRPFLPKEEKIKFLGGKTIYSERIVVTDGGKRFFKLSDGSVIIENKTYY